MGEGRRGGSRQAGIEQVVVAREPVDGGVADPKVVFVAGTMRSGSTILGEVLGAQPGWFDAGEVRNIWDVGEWSVCSCGDAAPECPVWGPVIADLRTAVAHLPGGLQWMMGFQERRLRTASIPGVAYAIRSERFRRAHDVAQYLEIRRLLYRRLAAVTGASIVVDASKHVGDGLLLTLDRELTYDYLHLVRDPRAVADSEAHHVSWEGVSPNAYPPGRTVLKSAGSWTLKNFACSHWLRPAADRWMTVRYEDWAADPEGVTSRIVAQVEGASTSARARGFVDDRTVVLDRTHTVMGNPSRFATGRRAISSGTHGLSTADSVLVGAISAPVRWWYRY